MCQYVLPTTLLPQGYSVRQVAFRFSKIPNAEEAVQLNYASCNHAYLVDRWPSMDDVATKRFMVRLNLFTQTIAMCASTLHTMIQDQCLFAPQRLYISSPERPAVLNRRYGVNASPFFKTYFFSSSSANFLSFFFFLPSVKIRRSKQQNSFFISCKTRRKIFSS